MKKGDERCKERNETNGQVRGVEKNMQETRNKMEVAKVYKLLPGKFSVGINP